MKLLFITSYFFPEQAASSYIGDSLREELCTQGIEIVLYAPMPSRGVSPEVKKEYRKKKEEHFYNNRMTVHRFSLLSEGSNSILRMLRYCIYCIKQFNRAVFANDARLCDVLFVTSTPPIQGAMAAMVRSLRGLPIVYNLQDIFPDSLVGTGLTHKGSLIWKIGRKIEDYTYRHADKIIVISRDFKRNIMAKGVPEDKIEVIYNWVDENVVVDVPRTGNKLFDKYNFDHTKFYVTYCGNIGMTQNMDMLLDVAKELENEAQDVHFVLVGEGAYREQVVKKIAGREGDDGAVRGTTIPNVTLLPFQPYEDISHVFSLGDVSLVVSKPGVGENSVPSKTWSIMSASRPVLANFDENELKEIICDHHCGIFTKAGDKEAFKNAILILRNNPDLCREYGANGHKFVIDNLTKEKGTQKYVDVIRKVASMKK